MIFVGYELGSKGYQFWDAALRHFKISHDVKFEETQFPVRETTLTQLTLALASDQTISLLDINHDKLGLDLVKLAQPPTRPTSPGQPTQQWSASPPQTPMAPPPLPWRHSELPNVGPAPLQPQAP